MSRKTIQIIERVVGCAGVASMSYLAAGAYSKIGHNGPNIFVGLLLAGIFFAAVIWDSFQEE